MSRYGNYAQPDPRYFQVGNAFLGGVQQSRDNQRQNALLDMDRQQLGLQQRRQGMMEDQYLREIQGQQQASQAQQAAIQRRAQILAEVLPDEFKDMAGELAYELDEADVAKLVQERAAPGGNEAYTLSPGSARYGADGQLIAQQPFAPANSIVIQTPSGQEAFNPRTQATTLISSRDEQRAAEVADTTAVESAKADVQAKAESDKKAKADKAALAGWDAGLSNLTKSLGGTDTGPLVGRLPSLTANQQVADASVAALAPVLKAIFRTAGEGTFTDRDQQMLLDMIPTRKAHPEAAAAIISNIDAIVRAKLGAPPLQQATQTRRRYNPATGKIE